MQPSRILLLRHAEEPDDIADADLSLAGRKRADSLAVYIPEKFGAPDFVFASAPNKSSARTFLTVRPLCDAIHRRPSTTFAAEDSMGLATKLLCDATFADGTVVICWTHTQLTSLATALGVRARDFPEAWDEAVFNLIVQLTYKEGGKPTVKRIVQPF
jgi:hypothetical protein